MKETKLKKWMVPLIGGSALLGGLIAGVAGVAGAQTSTATPSAPSSGLMGRLHSHAPLGQDGNITAISGSTITLQEEADEGGATYSVDASAAGDLSAFKVGDKVFVEGTVSGTNVSATSISSGHPHSQGDNDKETNDDGGQNDTQDPGQTDGENANQ